jgi:hypothetical protein
MIDLPPNLHYLLVMPPNPLVAIIAFPDLIVLQPNEF